VTPERASGAAHELHELIGDLGESRMLGQELRIQTVDAQGLRVAVTLGIDVEVQMTIGHLAIMQFHAGELDQAVSALGFQAGGFCIKDDLAHAM
jgi:hypothetical protein